MTEEPPPPLILAHRGFHRRFRENTRAAVVAAMDVGAHGVEIDVRTTADGKRILFHDRTYRRKPIASLTLGRLPAWVPSLEEVLRRVERWSDFLVNIELKEPEVDGDLLALLGSLPPSRVVVSSFQLEAATEVARNLPHVPVGWLRERPSAADVSTAKKAGCALLIVHRRGATAAVAAKAARLRMNLWAWGVNNLSEARRMAALGVQAIITDRPDLLLKEDLRPHAPPQTSRRKGRRES
jgi:glycerophosphoryl diester phosphodiesterase